MARSVQIKGIDKLQKKLRKSATMADVKTVVRTNGIEMNRTASRLAPVDTGFLRRSIVFAIADGGLTATSTAGAEYAPYLEYGTRFMSAQPFMRPAYNQQKAKFKSDIGRLVK